MGYWLKRLMHTESSLASDETYRYLLPTVGLYSAFSVQVQATRYQARAELTTQDWIRDAISRIELIHSGTEVVKSMRGAEVNALNTFDFGRIPPYKHVEDDAVNCIDTLYLLAGRSLQDKEYMFDMARMPNAEIVLTNSIREDAARGFDDNTLQYKIWGWRWMGDPVPMVKGYMKANERLYYTTSADGVIKPLQIATGRRIRRILVKGWTERQSIASHFDVLELQVNEGEYSPEKHDNMMELAIQNKLDYNLDLRQQLSMYDHIVNSTVQTDAFIPYHTIVQATMYPARADHNVSASCANGVIDGVIVLDSTGSFTGSNIEIAVDGAGYQRAVLLGFDKEKDLSDMLDTRGMGKLELEITENNASRVISVVVEEEVLY